MDPVSLAISVVLMIASAAITVALTPKQKAQQQSPATLSDFQFPQFEEGTPQAVVFGDVWCEDWTVLWYGDLESQAIKKKSGGKK